MEMQAESHVQSTKKNEGRPYRSHLHPACFACRKRKSRCKTRNTSATCIMCQAHGTDCRFPRPDDPFQTPQNLRSSPRKSAANAQARFVDTYGSLHPRSNNPQALGQHTDLSEPSPDNLIHFDSSRTPPAFNADRPLSAPRNDSGGDGLPNLIGIVAEAADGNSHIISPAVADDNDILESYLSTAQTEKRRCLARSSPTSNGPLRPVRFNAVPRRPLGVSVKQSVAESKLEVIERYMDPHIDEFLNL